MCEFTGFAENLLAAEGRRPRRLDSLVRLLLMEACVASAPKLPFADGARRDMVTPGWANHLLGVITDLKQAAVEPAEFAARIGAHKGPEPIDAFVAEVYAAYQKALHDAGAYDVPGLYWEARAVCETGTPRILKGVELVALDGFDDFTPSQARLIAAMAPHVPRMVVGLNYDMRPERADLFDVPRTAHDRLKTALESKGLDVVRTPDLFPPPPETWVQYAAATLLPQDRIVPKTATKNWRD